MVSIRIEGCTVEDAPGLSRNNCRAFWGQPMWRMMWPADLGVEFMTEQFQKRLPMSLSENRDTMRHQKAVDIDTGAIVGYIRWKLPAEALNSPGDESVWPEAQSPAMSEEKMKEFEELKASAWWQGRKDIDELDEPTYVIRDRIKAERPYIVLSYLAVSPENAGKGIATALVASGLTQAEKLGFPIFVYAFKSARGVYERLGFKEVDRLIQDDTAYGGTGEYGVYYMIYEPPEMHSRGQE